MVGSAAAGSLLSRLPAGEVGLLTNPLLRREAKLANAEFTENQANLPNVSNVVWMMSRTLMCSGTGFQSAVTLRSRG